MAPLYRSLRRWPTVCTLGLDHRKKRLCRREVRLRGGKAECRLLKQRGKLRVGFFGKIAFGHFEHGFLLSVLRRPRWAALRRRNQAG